MLWFKGRVIRTTAEHPFWVDGKGWTAAGELKAGDNLLASDKTRLPVENVSEPGILKWSTASGLLTGTRIL
jgi:intein/homing endonuclease